MHSSKLLIKMLYHLLSPNGRIRGARRSWRPSRLFLESGSQSALEVTQLKWNRVSTTTGKKKYNNNKKNHHHPKPTQPERDWCLLSSKIKLIPSEELSGVDFSDYCSMKKKNRQLFFTNHKTMMKRRTGAVEDFMWMNTRHPSADEHCPHSNAPTSTEM